MQLLSSDAQGSGAVLTQNDHQTFIAMEIVWNAASTFIRISMLLLYIRIFAISWFRILCWAILVVNILAMISTILATCLICRPIMYSFDKTIPNGHCGDVFSFENYTALLSFILNLIIVLLPMPMLWGLPLQKNKKIGLSIVFGMGIT